MEEENSNQLKRILIAPDKFKGTIDAAKIWGNFALLLW